LELLVPVRDLKQARVVFDLGVDAIYIGVKGLCRFEEKAVTVSECIRILEYAGNIPGKKVHLALNRIPDSVRIRQFFDTLKDLAAKGASSVILNDIGLIQEVRLRFPGIFITLSIGSAPFNIEEVKFLQGFGLNRVILPYSASLKQIILIKENSGIEIELFVESFKGFTPLQRCFTFTGKCYISSYYRQVARDKSLVFGSAKRGGCFKPCLDNYGLQKRKISLMQQPAYSEIDIKDALPYISALKIGGGMSFIKLKDRINSVLKIIKQN